MKNPHGLLRYLHECSENPFAASLPPKLRRRTTLKKQSECHQKADALAPDAMNYGPELSNAELQTVLEALVFACDTQTALRDMAPAHRKPEISTQIVAMLTLIPRLRREQTQREPERAAPLWEGAQNAGSEGKADSQREGFVLFDADVLLLLDALALWREGGEREAGSAASNPVLEKLVEEALRRNLTW